MPEPRTSAIRRDPRRAPQALLRGKIDAHKTGHYLNNLFLKELFSSPDNYAVY